SPSRLQRGILRCKTTKGAVSMMNSMRKRTCALLIVLAVAAASVIAAAPDPNNPTGTAGVIMIDKVGGFVRFFNPTTLAEISNLQLEAPPHELAISADHKTAFVPLYGDGVYGRDPNPGPQTRRVEWH